MKLSPFPPSPPPSLSLSSHQVLYLEKAFDASSQQQAKEERLPLVGRTREG